MPPYDRTDYPTVALYRKCLAKYSPGEPPTFTSLEGFVDALVVVEGLKRAGKDITREKFIAAIESIDEMNVGLGPRLVLNYSATDHKRFDNVDPTVVRGATRAAARLVFAREVNEEKVRGDVPRDSHTFPHAFVETHHRPKSFTT